MNSPDWPAVIAAFASRRVLVIGDVMLDEYIAGDARRVCPEAPVPVVEATSRWVAAGGAGNAATNAAALGARVMLGGVVGSDAAAEGLILALKAAGVDAAGLVVDPDRPTTTKMRVLARGQQVIRVDTESTASLPARPTELLAAWAERTMHEVDAVLVSDYGKGVVGRELAARVIAAARRVGRPVVIDPKGTDASRYRGATLVKPNLSELSDLTGRPIRSNQDLREAGHQLVEMLPETAILVTRGADGMALFRTGCPALTLAAAPARRVFDVTGAGDTAAEALTLGLASGLTPEHAARVANAAASIAVCKVGTAIVSPAELTAALAEATAEFTSYLA